MLSRWTSAAAIAASSSMALSPSSRAVANHSLVVHSTSSGKRERASYAMRSLLSNLMRGWKTVSTSARSQARRIRALAPERPWRLSTRRSDLRMARRTPRGVPTLCAFECDLARTSGGDRVQQLVARAGRPQAIGRACRVRCFDLVWNELFSKCDQSYVREELVHRLAELELVEADDIRADDDRVGVVRRDELDSLPAVETVADRFQVGVAVEREHQRFRGKSFPLDDQDSQRARAQRPHTGGRPLVAWISNRQE